MKSGYNQLFSSARRAEVLAPRGPADGLYARDLERLMKQSLATLILSIMASGQALGLDDVIVPEVIEPHESPTDDPWIPRPEEMLSTAAVRCEPVVCGIYESIQVNVDHRGCNIPGDAANEPSIAIDPTDPRKIVIGWRQFDSIESAFRQAGYAYSHDAGYSWNFPGSVDPGVFGSDPVLMADTDGTFFYLTINREQMRLFRSFDAGVTWPAATVIVERLVDKPWMTIDQTDGIGEGNIYIRGIGLGLTRSVDGGLTFEDPISDITPAWPTMAVDDNGTLFVAGKHPEFARLKNAKDPVQVPVVDLSSEVDLGGDMVGGGTRPNDSGLLGQIWVATSMSQGATYGNVYLLGSVDYRTGYILDMAFVRSTDGGLTWSERVRVSDDPPDAHVYHWFSMMSVAPNGRIDAVWIDTRNFPDAPDDNFGELYYSYSIDAGVTWSTNVPVSPVFDSHVGSAGGDDKLGDYYHMLSDNLGVNVAYAATFNGEQDIYFLRIGPWDCNGNEIPDEDDLSCGGGNICNDVPGSFDCNANEIPDECEYRMDFDGDRVTTLSDFAAFQRCFTGPQEQIGLCCSLLDQNNDASVDLTDYKQFQSILTGP